MIPLQRWKKTKEQASNAVQAVQTSVETVLAPPGAGELSGAVKAGTLIVTELPIHAAKTKSLARELEKETGKEGVVENDWGFRKNAKWESRFFRYVGTSKNIPKKKK